MKNEQGLLLVGAAALVLLLVVRKTTGAQAAAGAARPGINASTSNFWQGVLANFGGGVKSGATMQTGGQFAGAVPMDVRQFANGTYSVGGTYVDPGQVTYDNVTGQVTQAGTSDMYTALAPATYGF